MSESIRDSLINIFDMPERERKNYYTVNEYAEKLGCHRTTVTNYIRTGALPGCIMVGQRYMIPKFVGNAKFQQLKAHIRESPGKIKDPVLNNAHLAVSISLELRDRIREEVRHCRFESISDAVRYALEKEFGGNVQ